MNSLDFEGYWLAGGTHEMPAKSGIYCVYASKHKADYDTVALRKLLYIGESHDVRGRIKKHERWNEWESKLHHGEVLCFSVALIRSSVRERVEAAMIYKHKPPCNTEYKYSFPFDTTTIQTTGKNKFLEPRLTASRT